MFDLKPGDYVECIDNRRQFPFSTIMPEAERLYTVEDVRFIAGSYSIRLNELAPSCTLGGACACGHCGWHERRFRLVYRPDPRNLQLFRAMLHSPGPAIADPVTADY